VTAVIGDGLTVSQAAEKPGLARQTLHSWLARYEAPGLEPLAGDQSIPMLNQKNKGKKPPGYKIGSTKSE
jgi:transposase